MKIVIAPDSYEESLSALQVATQIEHDGGAGMVQALGAKLLDVNGKPVAYGGAALARLDSIDLSEFDARIKSCRIDVACDVANPLLGETGASAVFGPQKGASPEQVKQLDEALAQFARIIQRDLQCDVLSVAGGGAAGGMGAGLFAFCQATLRPGIEIVTDALGLDALVQDATLVITGEGRIDSQTIHGKVPVGVARVAKRYHKPTIAIAGSLTYDAGVVHQHGLDAIFSVIYRICSLQEALDEAADNVRIAARNIAATLATGMQIL